MEKFFKLKELGTDVKTEILGGLTTFFTMAYVFIVVPKVLSVSGIPFSATLAATILVAFFGSVLMGLVANRPFAVAPYIGETAFFSYTVVLALGFTWQAALGAIFVSGLIFFILTLLKVRPWLVNSMPETMKITFTTGLGLFLLLVGLSETGIIKFTTDSIPLSVGDFHSKTVILALLTFTLILVLLARRIKGAILIGILASTAVGIMLGEVQLPSKIMSMPPSLIPTLGQLDIMSVFQLKFLPVFFIVFLLVFLDTTGCLIGLCYKANLLDKEGKLPQIERPMVCDSITTMLSSFLGSITSGAYIESATGIADGGKSGLTAIVAGILFLSGLFFAPLFAMIPAFAYGPAILIVGLMMVSVVANLNFDDVTEYMPAIFAVAVMTFSYNIGIGMAAGFILYPLVKVFSGRYKETNAATWIFAVFSVIFFVLFPH